MSGHDGMGRSAWFRSFAVGVAMIAACACGSGATIPEASRPRAVRAAIPANGSVTLADESFRASTPVAEEMPPLVVPKPRELSLENGMHVVLIERHDLPLVALQLLVPHGADDARPRLGAFAMETLLRGNRDREGRSARDRLDALAVGVVGWGAPDSVGVGISCLRDKLLPTLSIVSEVLSSPKLDTAVVETVRGELLAAFEKDKSSITSVQQWAIREALYPVGHPYRDVLRDRASDIRAVTLADIHRFLRAHVTPNGMTVVVAGDVTASELESNLRRTFGAWRGPPTFRPPSPPAAPRPAGKAGRIFLVDHPNASQTHIAVVAPAISRGSSDYVPAMVYNRILGGGASSRLFRNLREEKGLTYGVWSSISTRHGPGELTAGGAVIRDKTGIAVREILREIDRLATEPVSESELGAAADGLARELPSRFETLGGILWSYGETPVHGLPADELSTRATRFAQVTPEDVMRIGRTYFDRDALRIVVSGDASIVRKDLEDLDLGPIQSIDPTAPTKR